MSACKYAAALTDRNLEPGDLPSRAEAERAGCGSTTVLEHRRGTCTCGDEPDTTPTPTDETGGRVKLTSQGGEFDLPHRTTPIEGHDDWARIFEEFDLDPAKYQIVDDTVSMSKWNQSKRTENGDRDIVWLWAYKARFTLRRVEVNLPALYAEARENPALTVRQRDGVSEGTRIPRTVVVAWADIQTGKVDSLGGTRELLHRLDEKRARLRTYLDVNPAERVIVADVGDIVEGFENVTSQAHTNDLSLMDQVDIAATEMWKTIRLCAEYAPVDVLAIPSNHAQWRAGKGLMGKPTDDWGLHINKRLQHLAGEIGLDVTFHRPADDWSENLVHDVHGTRLGLAHGHQAAHPDKVTTWWGKMSHAGVMDCDVLLSGHFHHLRVQPSGRSPRTGRARWHLQAPTLDNGSAWVNNTMGEDGDPGLLVFGINADGFDLSSLSVL